jgi:hypothetical protein
MTETLAVSNSASGSAAFADALRRARRQRFSATDDLSDALCDYVRSLRAHGDSWEDAVSAVGAQARLVSPRDAAPSERGWEDRWRRYYALYDTLIQETIRTYVLGADVEAATGNADCSGCSSATV